MTVTPLAIEIHEEPAGLVVQGTLKTVTVTLTDETSGVLTDPADVELVVTQPSGAQTIFSHSGGTLPKLSTGVYAVEIDTSGQSGAYGYEVVTDGDRRHRAFDVKATTSPAPSAVRTVVDGGNAFLSMFFLVLDGGGA